MVFQNRQQAGKLLGERLKEQIGEGEKVMVLGIPRGGVVVAAEVAKALKAPLGLLIVKKIGAPGNPELAVGAVGEDGGVVWNQELMASLGLSPEALEPEVERAKSKIKNYREKFKVKKLELENKTVIVVDDGIATGATAEAALVYLNSKLKTQNSKVILAVPVIAADTVEKLKSLADELVYLDAPKDFWAVGQFYREFDQTTDEEVVRIISNF